MTSSMARNSLQRFAMVSALASTFCLPVSAQNSTAPISVGAVLSLTGPLAVAGLPERDGIQLALKLVNAAGGVNGRPLELTIEDDASSPDVAVSKANALIFTRKVKALLGGTGIGASVAMGGLTSGNKLPQVAFTGLGPAVERDRRCVFHLLPAQELNARSLLEYATKALKAKRIAILHDTGFGQSVNVSLQALGAEYGVEYIEVEKFEIGTNDITTQASKVRAAKPDAVFIVASNPTPFRNARQVKIGAPIIAAHPSAPFDVVKAMGDGAEGVVFADFVVSEEPLPNQKAFVAAFQKEYGRLPKNFDAAGFDSVNLLAQALGKVGPDASSEALCTALRAPYQGALANYDLSAADMGGLRTSSFVYSQYTAGKFTRLSFRVNP